MSKRQEWGSKLGFILAASGSAIGLGNIVFFPANAYKYGAGAFYLPYLIALVLVGIPVMILELGLGGMTRKAFPAAMRKLLGAKGEYLGWAAIINSSIITMYYIAILGWVVGMALGCFGSLWKASIPVPAFGMADGALPNPYAYFFNMISSYWSLFLVLIVWVLNVVICRKSAESIETAVKYIVPTMWIMMIGLIIRGLSLPGGFDGVILLFNPDWAVMSSAEVWKGAFGQMFFTLSLGFGIMTAYASYTSKKTSLTVSGITISLMNCSFEFIAGLAIFSLLFVYSVIPKASTLSMMFFVVPQGIANLPGSVAVFGAMFFVLLFVAGISSSISLVESLSAALIDKYRWSRAKTLTGIGIIGFIGSAIFTLPAVIDKGLETNGTLGLTILDLMDHWAFTYGLIGVGLVECILLGWLWGMKGFRENLNKNGGIQLGEWFNVLIRWVVPVILSVILIWSLVEEFKGGPSKIYGWDFSMGDFTNLPVIAFLSWILLVFGGSAILTSAGTYNEEEAGEQILEGAE